MKKVKDRKPWNVTRFVYAFEFSVVRVPRKKKKLISPLTTRKLYKKYVATGSKRKKVENRNYRFFTSSNQFQEILEVEEEYDNRIVWPGRKRCYFPKKVFRSSRENISCIIVVVIFDFKGNRIWILSSAWAPDRGRLLSPRQKRFLNPFGLKRCILDI